MKRRPLSLRVREHASHMRSLAFETGISAFVSHWLYDVFRWFFQ